MINNIENTKLEKIINYTSSSITLLGSLKKQNIIIWIYNKIVNDDIKIYKNIFESMEFKNGNDKWYYYNKIFPSNFSIRILYPAGPKSIIRASFQKKKIFNDTYKYFMQMLENNPKMFEIPQWVENILLSTSSAKILSKIANDSIENEKKRIIYFNKSYLPNGDNTSKYVLVKDTKWIDDNINNLYIVAWTMDRELLSIRTLQKKHLGLLKKIKKNGLKLIKEKYGMDENEIIIFVHYLPSVYQLHIHFTHYMNTIGFTPGKSHLLDQIISNIEIDGNYYKKNKITILVQENHPYLSNF